MKCELRRRLAGRVIGLVVLLAAPATAQWDPANGQWGKSDPTDVRVMTWNVRDHICSTNTKTEAQNSWTALVQIVAALKPDVLIMQETGDNSGNGTGTGVDTVANLTTTLQLLQYGGSDPFRGGVVGAYVQKYAAAVDLPHVFVSTVTDNYNRNVVLSRWPFADLNGDTVSQRSDTPLVMPDAYAPGGTGGIRGFMFAEIDLPDESYAGDLVIGNAHLKAGSATSDQTDRERAARNVAYYIDHLFNGAGTGAPDPYSKIVDSPVAQTILAEHTPVIIGGDWNEDELNNGRKGPAEWLTCAAASGGTDGTDRDRSDMTYDAAVNPYDGRRQTYGSTSKLDYIAWQDSIATARREFTFYSAGLPATTWMPLELRGFANPPLASGLASDHRPVIVDFILPAATPPTLCGDANCDGVVDTADIDAFVTAVVSGPGAWAALTGAGCEFLAACDINDDGVVDTADIDGFVAAVVGGGCE